MTEQNSIKNNLGTELNQYYRRFPLQKLFLCEEKVVEMGLEPNDKMQPAFFIQTEAGEHISVTIIRPQELSRVLEWLNLLKTGVKVEFKDFGQFSKVIQDVFKVYSERTALA